MRFPPMRAGALLVLPLLAACGAAPDTGASAGSNAAPIASRGQADVADLESDPNVVRVAVGSADHTTLVAALKAAELVDALANPGPFTVFAPVNSAFDKLPAGALDDLLKPENKGKLKTVLYHHVVTSSRTMDAFADGEVVGMVSGSSETIRKTADGNFIGDARILATVPASNGVVHVIDAVLLPK